MSYIDRDFHTNIALGAYSNIVRWSKMGYTPTMNTTESDIWSAAGVYVFPPSAMQMEVIGGANDVGTVIHSGNSTGGSTTTLITAGENFNTTTAAGDLVILDKSGTTPEWGYITSVDSDTQVTCSGGFSSGGTGSGRAYSIVDKSAATGAHAVKIEYLNGSYVPDSEIVILNGATAVATVQTDLFRINSFRVISVGTLGAAGTALQLRETDDAPVYSYITAGYTRARNTMYTVPSGKTLYVTSINAGYGYSLNTTHYCRIYTRANVEPSTGFLTGDLFYSYSEMVLQNSFATVDLKTETKLPAKTDIKVSGIATYTAGIASVTLRGFLITG